MPDHAPPPRPGQVFVFHYPRSNELEARPAYRRRCILVRSVRLLDQEPLRTITLRMNPLRRRGRTLVTGWDFDARGERSFYLESMREFRRQTWLALALFDPLDDQAGPLWLPWTFAPTATSRLRLAEACRVFGGAADDDGVIEHNLCVAPIIDLAAFLQATRAPHAAKAK